MTSFTFLLVFKIGRVLLIMQYLSAFIIIICLLGFETHSANQQTLSGVWIVVNICLEPQWHRLIIEERKKERD